MNIFYYSNLFGTTRARETAGTAYVV